MHGSGVVYQYRGKKVRISRKAMLLKGLYTGMMVTGLAGLVVLLFPLALSEGRYYVRSMTQSSQQQITVETNEVTSPTFAKLLNNKYLKQLSPTDQEFSVVIPKLAINTKVFPRINPADRKEYGGVLEQGAAHAKGTYLPGEDGTIFIFAHSTDSYLNSLRFNAPFFLLRKLQKDDQIFIVYHGVVFPYLVTDERIVDEEDAQYLKPKKLGEELILQTCWPPGISQKRLLVFAKPSGADIHKNMTYSR